MAEQGGGDPNQLPPHDNNEDSGLEGERYFIPGWGLGRLATLLVIHAQNLFTNREKISATHETAKKQ